MTAPDLPAFIRAHALSLRHASQDTRDRLEEVARALEERERLRRENEAAWLWEQTLLRVIATLAIPAEALLLIEASDPRLSSELREGFEESVGAARAALADARGGEGGGS